MRVAMEGSIATVSQPSLDLFSDDEITFSVRELAEAVQLVLGKAFRDGVWVRGEIQGLQERGGHLYFSLTEDGAEGRATISVVLFAGTLARLRPVLQRARMRLDNGMAVRIGGTLDFYAPTGRLSFKMATIDAAYTIGRLSAERDRLLRALVSEGLLDRNKRVSMAAAPHTIGLVTSRDSAAFHDLTKELSASGLGFRILIADTRVQGASAPEQIARAISTLAGTAGIEVIAVVRGGGARTDLAAFDAEAVARAIAASRVPILTGVGHEVDSSVADAVAHAALKTPTAVAGYLIDRVRAFIIRAEQGWSGVERRTLQQLARSEQRLEVAGHGVRRAAGNALAFAEQRVLVAEARVGAVDPVRTLARGWSITRRPGGTLVRSADALTPGDELVTTFATSMVRSRVEGSPA
jgi:exodeoxyribonuclease VII large subunit